MKTKRKRTAGISQNLNTEHNPLCTGYLFADIKSGAKLIMGYSLRRVNSYYGLSLLFFSFVTSRKSNDAVYNSIFDMGH